VLNEDSLAAVKLRRQSKLKFIKTIRPESLKRPTSYLNTDIGGQVAMDQTDCTLVGYRKVGASMVHDVELGTLTVSTPSPLETNDHVTASLAKSFGTFVTASSSAIEPHGDKNQQCLYNAISMPTLIEQNHALSINSSSLPELTSDLALLDDLVYWRSAANASKNPPKDGTSDVSSISSWQESKNESFVNGLTSNPSNTLSILASSYPGTESGIELSEQLATNSGSVESCPLAVESSMASISMNGLGSDSNASRKSVDISLGRVDCAEGIDNLERTLIEEDAEPASEAVDASAINIFLGSDEGIRTDDLGLAIVDVSENVTERNHKDVAVMKEFSCTAMEMIREEFSCETTRRSSLCNTEPLVLLEPIWVPTDKSELSGRTEKLSDASTGISSVDTTGISSASSSGIPPVGDVIESLVGHAICSGTEDRNSDLIPVSPGLDFNIDVDSDFLEERSSVGGTEEGDEYKSESKAARQRLVADVAEHMIQFISAKEMLRKKLNFQGHFYR